MLSGWLSRGWLFLALAIGAAIVLTSVVARLAARLAPSAAPDIPARLLPVCGALALVAIGTDAWIFNLQGFSYEDRLSRFAAPFAGDHWRHTAIIGGLLRGSEAVFLPNSELVYQILWHHGAAATIAVLPPMPTLFKYELGISLATGFVFCFLLLWLALMLRPVLARWWWGLALVAVLLGTDGDLFNAALSLIARGEIAIAADASSTIPSVFRYFSAKLVSLTAPQHAAFFILMSVALAEMIRGCQLARSGEPGWRAAFAIAAGFVVPAVLFSPVLSLLFLPLLYASALLYLAPPRQGAGFLLVSGLVALAAAIAAHCLILRFPPWEPFLRPNLTGGGSGRYGLSLVPWIRDPADWARQLPLSLVAMAGVTGAALTVGLIWAAFRCRSVLREPLVMALIGGIVLWNFMVVDTEIQRHFSMVIAVVGAIVIAAHFPTLAGSRGRRLAGAASVALCVGICLGLNGILVRAYTRNASFMPLTVAWPDYFCANDLIARKYPGLAVIVRTPVNFELPISAEATTSLVWSQIAVVHQRAPAETARVLDEINPRDWHTFRGQGEADGPRLVSTLRSLGYDGAIWGPLEEREYGPKLQAMFARPENFLDGCGTVGLYTLGGGGGHQAGPDAANRHQKFMNESAVFFDALFSRAPGIDARLAKIHLDAAGAGQNLARGARAVQSSTHFSSVASYAIDGNSALSGVPMAFTDNQYSPWWEVDLGAIRDIGSLRISTLESTPYPQFELKAFYVLVSDTPFRSDKLFEAGTQPGVTSYYIPGRLAGTTSIDIGRHGRYVRLQGTTLGHLVLSEIEVLGPFVEKSKRE